MSIQFASVAKGLCRAYSEGPEGVAPSVGLPPDESRSLNKKRKSKEVDVRPIILSCRLLWQPCGSMHSSKRFNRFVEGRWWNDFLDGRQSGRGALHVSA